MVIFLPHSSAVRSGTICIRLYVYVALSSTYAPFHVYENHVGLSTTKVIFEAEARLSFLATVCVKIPCGPESRSRFFLFR